MGGGIFLYKLLFVICVDCSPFYYLCLDSLSEFKLRLAYYTKNIS